MITSWGGRRTYSGELTRIGDEPALPLPSILYVRHDLRLDSNDASTFSSMIDR